MSYRQALALFLLSVSATVRALFYEVSVDTGSLAGTDGAMYLQFSPRIESDHASISISGDGCADRDAGSAFLFQLTGPDGISPVLSEDPSGFLGLISYDTNRSFLSEAFSPTVEISTQAVLEPGSFEILACGFAIAGAIRAVRKRSAIAPGTWEPKSSSYTRTAPGR